MNIFDVVALISFSFMSYCYRLGLRHDDCDTKDSENQQYAPSKFLPRFLRFFTRAGAVDHCRNVGVAGDQYDHCHDNGTDFARCGSRLNTHSSFPQKVRILSALAELGDDALFGFLLGALFGVCVLSSGLFRAGYL